MGVMTGTILTISRGRWKWRRSIPPGGVFSATLPSYANDQLMHLGYHVYVLSRSRPTSGDKTVALLTVLVLLILLPSEHGSDLIRNRMRRWATR
jgi:phosphate transport system permease protein